jgi:CDP-glycerol glycerophosphotransferase (TagB/SpsB family)/glycosyltransferase involved in cell wall biosynthesis
MITRMNRWVRKCARRIARAWRAQGRALAGRKPVDPRAVLYESFAGNGVLCNPEAIFRQILATRDLDDLRHVWALDSPRRHRAIRAEFARDPRVSFVRRGSLRYHRALATSGYLVNNATFGPEFSKRDGQVYLNTWHGTPLKHMGYDMPRGSLESANTLRNFLSADYLLSQNPFMTQTMYADAYKLRGAFRGSILEEGYPRVDRQFLDHDRFLAGRERLERAGLPLRGRSIVLYAPTWKGDSFSRPEDDAETLLRATNRLQDLLGDDDYVVLLKTHQSVHALAKSRPEFRSVLVPNDIPTNLVLGLSSVLITDYSSIFFDYLASNRPIVFYTPDAEDYDAARGTYFAPEELPGPVTADLAAVAAVILDQHSGLLDLGAAPTYRAWRERFTPADDGESARRVVDAVFRGHLDGARHLSLADDGRSPVLLYLGGMRSNGITSSALNLLRSLDHERHDVSVVITRPRGGQRGANQALIDPRVRQFHRTGGMNGGKLPHARRKRSERRAAAQEHRESRAQAELWDDEWRRCFGDTRFAAAVDFSGYSPFWATLLLHAPGAQHSIWLHNDMAAEEHREIRGRKRMARSLRAIFALYPQFESLVSVSPALMAVNRRNLATRLEVEPARFTSARNLVDAQRVIVGSRADVRTLEGHPIDEQTEAVITPQWAHELHAHRGTKWFVSVGRFSREKNQARMLRAFASIATRHPETRLLLVGYGPLRDDLDREVRRLGLTGRAHVVGPYPNPFAIMAAADCFVLSSDYEGQPMVLLEAAIIGMPIVSVRFDSVADALDADSVHIVDQDDAALANGMLAYLAGRVPPSSLDVRTYTDECVHEFTSAILSARRRAQLS